MSFADDLGKFTRKVETKSAEVFIGVGEECLRSIQEGSEITGAPGQQVGQYGPGYHQGEVGGALKGSWQRWFASPTEQIIATDSPYAQQEEDGVTYRGTPITQHTTVGGPFSTRLTFAGFSKIVEAVTARVDK